MAINLKDTLSFKDGIGEGISRSLWKYTEVIGGHGLHKNPVTGISELDEIVFGPDHNTVTIGGVQYAMEQIFGVKGPITIPTLYDELQIGLTNASYSDLNIEVPLGQVTVPYTKQNRVFLFGIGLTGSAENAITKYPVDYREKSIQMTKQAEDGTQLEGIMLPFRYTTADLTETDQKKYFGKKVTDGYTGYYLKELDTVATIKHLWNTGSSEDEDELAQVTNEEVWTATRSTPVQTMTELQLKIGEKDIKEFFEITERVDEPRFNTVALFSGEYDSAQGDYTNVRMFSKLYIPTENMSLSKDLDIIYRVYGC